MKEYLIDYKSMATVRIKASSTKEAINILANVTHDIYFDVHLDQLKRVQLVNITNRDDDPEIVDVAEIES